MARKINWRRTIKEGETCKTGFLFHSLVMYYYLRLWLKPKILQRWDFSKCGWRRIADLRWSLEWLMHRSGGLPQWFLTWSVDACFFARKIETPQKFKFSCLLSILSPCDVSGDWLRFLTARGLTNYWPAVSIRVFSLLRLVSFWRHFVSKKGH